MAITPSPTESHTLESASTNVGPPFLIRVLDTPLCVRVQSMRIQELQLSLSMEIITILPCSEYIV